MNQKTPYHGSAPTGSQETRALTSQGQLQPPPRSPLWIRRGPVRPPPSVGTLCETFALRTRDDCDDVSKCLVHNTCRSRDGNASTNYSKVPASLRTPGRQPLESGWLASQFPTNTWRLETQRWIGSQFPGNWLASSNAWHLTVIMDIRSVSGGYPVRVWTPDRAHPLRSGSDFSFSGLRNLSRAQAIEHPKNEQDRRAMGRRLVTSKMYGLTAVIAQSSTDRRVVV